MVNMYPDKHGKWVGENIVFDKIKDSYKGKGFSCLYSLGIDKKNYREIDFVLITNKVILCLEVKGAETIECKDGIWFYKDYKREYSSHISPFQQSQSSIHPLIDSLKKNLKQSIYKKIFVDWGVVFPKANFNKYTPEAEKERICDLSRINDFESFLDELINFSLNRAQENNHLYEIINDQEINEIVKVLRPNITLHTGTNFFIHKSKEELIKLEDEQKDIYLNLLSEKYPHNIIKGGPGSGKTFLAIELSKKLSSQEKRSMFLCFNKFLANNIRNKLSEFENNKTKVFHIHDFMLKQIKKAGHESYLSEEKVQKDYYSNVMPKIFKDAIESLYQSGDLENFDHVIFDEGQDIMSQNIIDPIINYCTKGDFKYKNWSIFLDDNVQKEVYGVFDKNYLNDLENENQVLQLHHNYRNPQNFISKACQVAGVNDTPKAMRESDNIIKRKTFEEQNDNKDLFNKLKHLVKDLIEKQKVNPKSITILVAEKNIMNDILTLGEIAGKKICNIQDYHCMSEIKNEITISTISAFKGLENEIIILINKSISLSSWQKSVYYVGMTRALTDLYILSTKDSQLFNS